MPWFPPDSGLLASGDGSDPRGRLLHAGALPSTTPIAFGALVMLIGLWLFSSAINTPLALPSKADGADVRGIAEPVHVEFPAALSGEVDVLTQSTYDWSVGNSGAFRVVDASGRHVAEQRDWYLVEQVGRGDETYIVAISLDVADEGGFELIAPAGWDGHVAFIPHGNPPTEPDWRWIIETGLVTVVGGALAGVWGIRRRRWRQYITRLKEQLVANGYVVD